MKAHYNTADGRIGFEVAGDNVKDIFREIALVQEIFESEAACGCCKGTTIRFLYRVVDDYTFYELACQNIQCRARFSFGQHKKGGTLFPKYKEGDDWLPNRGWSRYQPKGEAPTNGPVSAPKQDGVHVFLDWDTAQNSPQWGSTWLQVAGVKYKLGTNGEYQKAA